MATYQVGNLEVSLITQMDEASKTIIEVIADLKNLKKEVSNNKDEIKKADKETKKAGKSAKDLGKNFKEALNLGKMYVALNYLRRYENVIKDTVKSSIAYVETVNKFKVSMGDMYQDAMKFQNKINEKFGLSKSLLMDYQANFNNIIKGIGGINAKAAYDLSETLTLMSIDYSSLFNASVEEAVQKFQAALTGQVRPIRSDSGFDITQQTLQGTLREIGINDRKISQMSQIEKRLLIIITLQKQMHAVAAEGDFSRTIEQPANQLRILKETLKDVTIAFGNFILGTLAPAMAYINGFFMALKEILELFSNVKVGDIAEEHKGLDLSLDDALDTDKATSGVKGVEKAVKDLKNAVLGIDELNIISPPTQTPSTDGGMGGIGGMGVDPRILEAISAYNSALEDTKMKATDIRDRLMEWLGFHKEGTDELGNTIWALDEGITRFEIIKGIIEGILVLAGLLLATSVLTKIMKLLGFNPGRGTVFGALFGVFTIAKSVYGIFDNWSKLMDGDASNNIEAFVGLLLNAGGLFFGLMLIIKVMTGTKGIISLFKTWGLKMLGVTAVILVTIGLISRLIEAWDDMSTLQRVFGIIGTAITLILGLAVALGAFHSAWSLGLAVAGIITGIALVVGSTNKAMRDTKNSVRVSNPFTESSFSNLSKQYATDHPDGYATGGFPTRGDYFLANENGVPEYVGSMGGKTAVANTHQIVEGISIGVSKANTETNILLRNLERIGTQLLAKDTDVYMDGRKVSEGIRQAQDGMGYNAVVGGWSYV